jgi:hypothetical protein
MCAARQLGLAWQAACGADTPSPITGSTAFYATLAALHFGSINSDNLMIISGISFLMYSHTSMDKQ